MAITPVNSIYNNLPAKNKSLLTFCADAQTPETVSDKTQNSFETPQESQYTQQPKKHSYWGILAALAIIGAILLLLAKAAGKGEGEAAGQTVKKAAEEASDNVIEAVEDEIESVKS